MATATYEENPQYRHWPEDSADTDNGSYINTCHACHLPFVGNKRRVTCRACATNPAGQTSRGSLLESVTNVVLGAIVALISQDIIFPFYGIHVTARSNIEMVIWFTGISLTRSFLLRRLFNWITLCRK